MKPITSLADLEAMPDGSSVVDEYDEEWERQGKYWRKARTYDAVYGYELWATRRVLTILVPEDDQ